MKIKRSVMLPPSRRVKNTRSFSTLSFLKFVVAILASLPFILSLFLYSSSLDDQSHKGSLLKQPPSIKSANDFLVELARLPLAGLRRRIEQDDVFQIKLFDSSNGKLSSCPFSWRLTPAWVVPSIRPAANRRQDDATIWFEHVSKAGGTSFCKLAMATMDRALVPKYYCMPPDGKLKDGRVGLWSNEKLKRYLNDTGHRIVSNEWQPFPSERWKLRESHLLYVTMVRDPLDRLLSAYRFWGILHNKQEPKPSLEEWLQKKHKVSESRSPLDMGFALHIGRYNFLTWKFSNGTMPQGKADVETNGLPNGVSFLDEELWMKPFTEAIQNLSKFDLVLIMELFSSSSSPLLASVLGWESVAAHPNQVVPSGQAQSSNASASLSTEQYIALWEANRFDMILYHWMKAVFLYKLSCS